jgi:hypothetical protein
MTKELAPATADNHYNIPTDGMAPGLAIMFNDRLYQRCRDMAHDMSKAEGFTPPHLLGKPYACFAVLTRAITWKLDPLAVAQSTYQTPGGRIGYEGKLVQAILENSGKFEGPIRFEHFGDWEKIRGKWKKAVSAKGNPIPVAAWEEKDEDGLGVVVRGKVKGESEERAFTMYLRECYPRNSTLWPLRPEQQICYTAVRAFGNIAAAGVLMGVPFNTDLGGEEMVDITPARPRKEDFQAKDEQTLPEAPGGQEGEETVYGAADAHSDGYSARMADKKITEIPAKVVQMQLQEPWDEGWKAADEEIGAASEAQKQENDAKAARRQQDKLV